MKKIGFFSLFLLALVAYGSKGYTMNTSQDLSVIKAARVAQGINDLDHSEVLILLLVTLTFVVLFGLAVLLIVRRLIRIGRAYRELVSNRWIDEPDAHWRKGEETDLYMQMHTEQQWLFYQFLSQGQDDTDTHDLLDLPHDWWS